MPVRRPPETRVSLILRLQDAADVAAWEEFVQVYSPVVRRIAIRQGFQAADADNIVQEVMLSVARSVTAWLERTDRGSFRTWLLRVARNRAFDLIHARATRTLATDGLEAEQVLGELSARSDLSPSSTSNTKELSFGGRLTKYARPLPITLGRPFGSRESMGFPSTKPPEY